MPGGRTRGNGHKLKYRRLPLNIRKQFVSCESDQTVANVAQKGGGVSILANMQKLSGHGLGDQDLGCSCLSMGFGLDDLQSSLQISAHLRFWDFVHFIYIYFCFSQSRAALISFHAVTVYQISAISTLRLFSSWTVPASVVFGLCLIPLLVLILPPSQKHEAKPSENIPPETGNCYYFLTLLKS